MANINNWGIDVFRIAEATNNRPLTAVVYTIMQVQPSWYNNNPFVLKMQGICDFGTGYGG